jgi:Tol biopolymer transport system component/tRNA A-37 threonylcarbamoyl transferase component Bud32
MSDVPQRLSAALADRCRIERELGQGGMATVYLAEDLKHDRKVAIKVLKPELAAVLGAERFVVEIKTTAALSHPHILPLFDSGEADGFLFYVMPYVEGETLRDRLNRETQLGVDEAVRITREIADALHYAHTHGVIHRDIKPENILLQNGRPMVADFGIALAVSAAAGGRMTETGLSLGTPHYMSPEQATAEKEITGRSDIYSLASVCYEMLTGNPPHVGSSAQQIIMKIITEQPADVTAHRKSVPPNVAAAIGRALEKLPADRFESSEKFAEALANPAFSTMARAGGAGHAGAARAQPGLLLGTIAATAVVTAALTFLLARPATQDPPLMRYRLALPDSQMPVYGSGAPVAAPDGSFIIYSGRLPAGQLGTQLWIKRRSAVEAVPIPGTNGAGFVSISPDGKRIAFDYGGNLRMLPIEGGVAENIASPFVQPFGNDWLNDSTLVYASAGTDSGGLVDLFAVSSEGGPATRLKVVQGARVAVVPHVIPGRDAVLFLLCISPTECDLHVYDFRDSTSKQLLPNSEFATYATSGHLLFERSGALLAARFDADKLEIIGETVVVAENASSNIAGVPYSLSADGTLIAVVGGSAGAGAPEELVWVDRSGRQEPLDPDMEPIMMTVSGSNHGWALSPDGTRLAIGLSTSSGDDIWVKRLPRGPLTRLTLDQVSEYRPRWTPDGRSVIFITPGDVRIRRADGTGRDSLYLNRQINELQLSRDGQWLVLREGAAGSVTGGRDISVMQLGVDSVPRSLLASPSYDETAPTLSPDGRWLLYVTNESGRWEVFLRSFPDVDRLRLQVSVSGGEAPLWSPNGREIFYLSSDRRMMAVPFSASPAPAVGTPKALFAVPSALLGVETTFMTPWVMAADGRFLMTRILDAQDERPPVYVVTQNLFSDLRARLPR